MNRSVASCVAAIVLVLASFETAHAEPPPPPPPHVVPFLKGDEDNVLAVTGAFGPAKNTTIVVTFDRREEGSFSGFALVPDPKAENGHRKLPLPPLPSGSIEGGIKMALIANLDKDTDDELVVQLHVFRTVSNGVDGFQYGTVEYAVLDWNGKKFVRVPALEHKLAAKMESREWGRTFSLSDEDLRNALGLDKPK